MYRGENNRTRSPLLGSPSYPDPTPTFAPLSEILLVTVHLCDSNFLSFLKTIKRNKTKTILMKFLIIIFWFRKDGWIVLVKIFWLLF